MSLKQTLARNVPTWTFYAVVSSLLWLTFSHAGMGASSVTATAAGRDFGWVYTAVLGVVTAMALVLLAMRRRV